MAWIFNDGFYYSTTAARIITRNPVIFSVTLYVYIRTCEKMHVESHAVLQRVVGVNTRLWRVH
jgi:hypothetical protein